MVRIKIESNIALTTFKQQEEAQKTFLPLSLALTEAECSFRCLEMNIKITESECCGCDSCDREI